MDDRALASRTWNWCWRWTRLDNGRFSKWSWLYLFIMCRPYNWLIIFEMIPESIELGGWVILLGGIAIGLVLFQSIHLLMDKITIITNSHQKDIFVRSGYF